MGIIQERIEKVFNELKKNRNIEEFILKIITNIDYSWKWQRDNANYEVDKQLKLLEKEGYVWQLVKK